MFDCSSSEICGLDLAELGYNVQVISFGTPRSGDEAYAAYYDLLVPNSWRVTHWRDLVPHVPPKHLNMRWKHSAHEAWYSSQFVLNRLCNVTELEKCSDSLLHFDVKVGFVFVFLSLSLSLSLFL